MVEAVTDGRIVAVLYVDPLGVYPRMRDVDCWDETRDARLYDGPHPVVAHPPCGPWSAMQKLSIKQPADCGLIAIDQVRRFGGVLEHPARSILWVAGGLPRPGELPDTFGGRSIEVEQVRWGHVARKPTWLYCVGIHDAGINPPKRTPTHWVGMKDRPSGLKWRSPQQRRRTPPAFAEWLVDLARSA